MSEDTSLHERREELRRQLAEGGYSTLADVLLDETGRLIQKVTRSPKPISFWYSAVAIALVTLLIGWLVSILLGEFDPLRRRSIPADIGSVAISFVGIIINKIYVGIVFATLRDHVLDAIESTSDLSDLQLWLAAVANTRRHFWFSLAFGIATGISLPISFATVLGTGFSYGSTIFYVIVGFQGAITLYYLVLFLALPARLSRYHFQLFAADPSSSGVIDRLSGMLHNYMYLVAAYMALVTVQYVVFTGFTSLTIAVLALLAWGPLVALFIVNHYSLAKIIGRSKTDALRDIQAQIEELWAKEHILSEKTLAHINKLMDFHDRVRATRNSTLNLRAGLGFANSLLLPLLAFLLANLNKVLDLFAR